MRYLPYAEDTSFGDQVCLQFLWGDVPVPNLGRSRPRNRFGNVRGRVEDQPRAARRVGGIDCHVPSECARTERAAEDIPPEFRQDGRIGGIEVQSCETQTNGGHDCFLLFLLFRAFLHVEGPEESMGYTVRGESRGQRRIDSPAGGESIIFWRNNP